MPPRQSNRMNAVDIGVCTYRRDTLRATLQSLAEQRNAPSFRVIVADNDSTDMRRFAIEKLGNELGLDLLYIHAPERNIAVARNACLHAASSHWIAFIDDDELADPHWLAALYEKGENADIVFGPVDARYDDDEARWLVEGDFHSARIDPAKAWNGYSGNVIIRREFFERHQLRFDPAWGRAGGEDTLFFFAAKQVGGRFSYSSTARVVEPVARSRASLRWLAIRRFRAGQTHGAMMRGQRATLLTAAMAAGKCAALLAAAGLSSWSRTRSARQFLRSALQAGVVAASAGLTPIATYEREQDR